ncbi:unnamed protein product [Clonostachys rosea]|uniref:Amine oxidase n=1 Tax=Bionectria ochroleuca TaxID=29856 RepID=A0ABY6UIN0_BIOOC|nr:unnamed protein product [Clonostachys rosea]
MTQVKAVDLLIHISGQPGTTKDSLAPPDYESQIHLALFNLRKIMITAGTSVKDIVKLTILIVNYDPAQRKHARHIQKFLNGHRCAMTLIPVSQLAVPSWLFEIDAVVAHRPQATLERPVISSATQETTDVIIIGAGLAGLSAAADVQRAGLSCIVLEGRDRVGGKTWSRPLSAENGPGVVDMGAAWINDTNQSKIYALAKRFGAEILEQNTTGNCVLEDVEGNVSTFKYGDLPKFDEATVRDVARIRDMVEADCQTLDKASPQGTEWDGVTFEEYLGRRGATDDSIRTATVWTRAMLGQDPKDLSALFFLGYCNSGGALLQMRSDRKGGGQHLRIRQGMQLMANGLAGEMPQGVVRLSSQVSHIIQQSNNDIDVVANGKNIRVRKVISTVPSPVLKNITFSPRLPPAKQAWAESSTYGYYTKAMMVFKTPFWVQKGYCGLIQSFTGPASVIRDTSSLPDEKYVLTCFLASDLGRAWAALPTSEREKVLIQQIGKLYNSPHEAARDFVEMATYEWVNDEFAGYGCPCPALTPGVLDTLGGNALREPVGNLHFAGTETAVQWKGYMEGAVESGERAAAEVVQDLAKPVQGRL